MLSSRKRYLKLSVEFVRNKTRRDTVCVYVYVCMFSFFYFLFFPRDNCSLFTVCRSVFVQIYTKGYTRAPGNGPSFRERIARSSHAKRSHSGASSELSLPACLPACLFLLSLFLSFRHSEYVVPILTGVPFSSVKMKNQSALD